MMSKLLLKSSLDFFFGEANCLADLVISLVRLKNPRTTPSMELMPAHMYTMSIRKRKHMRLQGRS